MVRGKKIEEHILSASKIKTFEDCGWVYWAKYHLGLPDSANEGSARGSICHMIFELLMVDRHKHHFDTITENKGIEKSPAIQRLVWKHLRSYGFDSQENYDMINKMVYVFFSLVFCIIHSQFVYFIYFCSNHIYWNLIWFNFN